MVRIIDNRIEAAERRKILGELAGIIGKEIENTNLKFYRVDDTKYFSSFHVYKSKFGGLLGRILGKRIMNIENSICMLKVNLKNNGYMGLATSIASKLEEEYCKRHNKFLSVDIEYRSS
jgi:hypothetical protein